MKENYQAAERRLAALTDSSDADALVQVGNEIDALSIGRKEDPRWNEWRRKKLDLWLKALDKMDRITDPHFDPNNAPSRNVAPPGVMGLRAGVSPDSIKDPNLRLEYERAIKQNAEKVTRYRLQYTIRRVEKDWGSKLKAYVDNHYTTEAKDLEELNTLIERNISNDSRKAQMKKEFTRKGGIGPR
jgi:hypothetical protein